MKLRLLVFICLLSVGGNINAQQTIYDVAQQNAQNTMYREIENGNGGFIAGMCFEGGIVILGGKQHSNGYYLGLHTVGYVLASDNVSIKAGIGAQMRSYVSHVFWDPSLYLKVDVNLYRGILYVTPGVEFILNDPFNGTYKFDEFNPKYGNMSLGDIIPQLGVGCNLGAARFELVYKHGIFPLSEKLKTTQYITLKIFLMWM